MGCLDLVPTEVGDNLGAHRADAHAGEQSKRECAVHQQLLPFRLRRVGGIEMDLLHIQGEQRHPDIIYIRDRSPGAVLEDVGNFKVFVIKA